MNYNLHYERLIDRAKNRTLECYKERHHIIPRCLGGTDDVENLVYLTAREHFIAHLLLIKIYPNEYGLIKAVQMMCVSSKNQDRSMNRMYGWLRERFSIAQSICQSGSKNSQYGTMWVSNIELEISKKVSKGYIPEGWVKGKNAWKPIKKKLEVQKISKLKRSIEICKLSVYYDIYRRFGFNKFVEITGYKYSKQNLVQNFSSKLDHFIPQNGKRRGIK